ncbi:MAG: hypothetical protein E6K25_07720 [Gammaproteobacteria bacterium]|nr:MAG: hypothetical protein E6K25_07720 [Gammaproteobacteria bacterium]
MRLRLLAPRYWLTWAGLGLLRAAALLPFPWMVAVGSTGARATARSALREPRDRAAGNSARLVAVPGAACADGAHRGRRASAGRRGARPRRDPAHRPLHAHGDGRPRARQRDAGQFSLPADAQ